MSKKILVVTGDGGEGYEAWYAVHRFQEEGFQPVVSAQTWESHPEFFREIMKCLKES